MDLKMIHDRCHEVGDCWIWTGCASGGYPLAKVKDRGVLLVRRLACELDNRPPEPRQPVAAHCNEKLCCNPAHLFPSSVKAIAKAAAKRGAFSGADRAAKIAATKRAAGKLTMQKAREIRMRTEAAHVLAPIYGVDKSLITRIRAGKCWREYSSPFAGLLR